ncbi:hypothetical protein F4823DRAFT_577122, partial [Ustulina deusta]
MDDAFHYLQSYGLQGNHCTLPFPHPIEKKLLVNSQVVRTIYKIADKSAVSEASYSTRDIHEPSHVFINDGKNGTLAAPNSQQVDQAVEGIAPGAASSRLLVWTAPDEKSLERVIQAYDKYYMERISGYQTHLYQLSLGVAICYGRLSLLL